MASLMLMLWLYRVHVQSISTCVERFRTIGRVKSRGIDRNQLHVIPARWFVVELCWAWWIDFYTISDRQLVTDIVSKICTEWSHWVLILRCVMSVVVVTCDAATEAFKPTTYVYMGILFRVERLSFTPWMVVIWGISLEGHWLWSVITDLLVESTWITTWLKIQGDNPVIPRLKVQSHWRVEVAHLYCRI